MNVIDVMADLIEDENTVVYIPINDNSLLVIPEEDRIYVPIFTDKSLCKEHTEEIIAKAVFNIVSDDQDFSGVVVNPGHQSTFVFEGWTLTALLTRKSTDSFTLHDENGNEIVKLW